MIIHELNNVTKITFTKCKVPADLNEVCIERYVGTRDASKQKNQIFFTDEEMLQLQEAIAQYNETFVVQ
jgi:hypothetical protein